MKYLNCKNACAEVCLCLDGHECSLKNDLKNGMTLLIGKTTNTILPGGKRLFRLFVDIELVQRIDRLSAETMRAFARRNGNGFLGMGFQR